MAALHSLQSFIALLIVLSVLVVAHEWGHFIVARLFGIRVDDFSIGFGKRLVRLGKRGDTEYNIRMLPLGGFVKIAGMEVDEAPLVLAKDKALGRGAPGDPDATQIPLIAENTPEAEPYTAPDGFNSKPLWQRSLVILAGPVMSFLTGYLIFCLMGWAVGLPLGKTLNKIGMVEPGGAGQKMGLRAGDVIESINGQRITDGGQMVSLIHDNLGRTVTLTVRRGDELLTKSGTPRPYLNENGKPALTVDVTDPGEAGKALGLRPGDALEAINGAEVTDDKNALSLLRAARGKSAEVMVRRGGQSVPLHGSLPRMADDALPRLNAHPFGVLMFSPMIASERTGFVASLRAGNALTVNIFRTLASLVQHGQLHNQVGGVIVMYTATDIAVKNGLGEVLSLAAQLSISLAIFNLLPIPILDGGHLLNFFIEWVRRGKKMTEAQQQWFLMTGLAVIGTLFILIMGKNIWQAFTHQLPQ